MKPDPYCLTITLLNLQATTRRLYLILTPHEQLKADNVWKGPPAKPLSVAWPTAAVDHPGQQQPRHLPLHPH